MENGNMTPLVPRQDGRLEWGNGVVSMLFDIAFNIKKMCAKMAKEGMD